MNIGFVETDWERNLKQVSPFLGVVLVGCVAFLMFLFIYNAVQGLATLAHTAVPSGVSGSIVLTSRQPLTYGSSAHFSSTVDGMAPDATSYIATVCFQGDKLVYQRSAQQGVEFPLLDQYQRDLAWDGKTASCTATLMYRAVNGARANVYMLGSTNFVVVPTQ